MPTNTDPRALVQAVEDADSAPSLFAAVKNLADARVKEAIPTLIRVLGYNNPGAAVAAVNGLIALGEPAVVPLLEQLDGYNYGARAWAIRALAGIRDPRGLEVLIAANSDFALSVRRAAARGLGNLRWSLLDRDSIPTAQQRALETLLQTTQDPEWVVRYAAVVGLESLAEALTEMYPDRLEAIATRFDRMARAEGEDTLAVRARVWLAQQRLSASTQTKSRV